MMPKLGPLARGLAWRAAAGAATPPSDIAGTELTVVCVREGAFVASPGALAPGAPTRPVNYRIRTERTALSGITTQRCRFRGNDPRQRQYGRT